MRIDVLGVGFDDLTMDQAVAEAQRLIASPDSHYIVTPNPEIVELCREDKSLLETVNAADMVLPDGIGIYYGAKLLGTPLRARLPGIDFAAHLMDAMAKKRQSLFLLGAKPGVAERAAEKLRRAHPGLLIAGTADGYFKDDARAAETIRASGADVAFVCLGAQKQELWMAAHAGETGPCLLIGLGGCLDVFSGDVKRAPVLFQRLGLEWFHRLLSDPRRLGRMMKLPRFMLHVLREK